MKDKLRELAERWKNRDYDETEHLQGYAMGIRQARDELLAILDADGDGGMSLFTGTIGGVHVGLHGTKESVEALDAFLESATHPARSGVVSDEDAGEVLRRFEGTVDDGGMDYMCRRMRMRAALEMDRFAKGERHER